LISRISHFERRQEISYSYQKPNRDIADDTDRNRKSRKPGFRLKSA